LPVVGFRLKDCRNDEEFVCREAKSLLTGLAWDVYKGDGEFACRGDREDGCRFKLVPAGF